MIRQGLRRWIAVGLLLGATSAGARVFWSWGSSTGGATGLLDPREAGWTRGYTATLRINGGAGELSVWSAQQALAEIPALLRQRTAQRGGRAFFATGHELAWGLACAEGRVVRYLIAAGPGRSVRIFELTQDFQAYRASRLPPAVAGIPGVPEIPEARVSQVLANETSGLTLASARCAADPREAQRRTDAVLASAGWERLLPCGEQAGFYLRGRDLLVASSVSAGPRGETVITLAHKRRAAGDRP